MRRSPGFAIGLPPASGSPEAWARRWRKVDPGGPAGSSRSIVPSSAATRQASAVTGFVTEAQRYSRPPSPRVALTRPATPTETCSAGQSSARSSASTRQIVGSRYRLTVGRLRTVVDSLSPQEQHRLRQMLQEPERMDYEGAEILLRRSAPKIELRLRSVAKEPWTVKWIETFLPGDVFYDVGANVGAYSLPAAKANAGAVPVVAFEPSAPTYHDLCVNIALNGCDEIVTPLPIALWSETALIPFVHHTLEPGSSDHSFAPPEELE